MPKRTHALAAPRTERPPGFKERPDERILCHCGNAFSETTQRWYTPAPRELVQLITGQHGWKTCENCRQTSYAPGVKQDRYRREARR